MANIMDKFGVPLPSGRNRTMSQPKISHKFRVIMLNFGTHVDEADSVAMNVDSVDLPSVEFDVHQLHNFSGNTSYFGKHNWKPLTVTIRDSIDNLSAKSVSRQLQKQLDFHRRLSSRTLQQKASYKFTMVIERTGGANPDDSLSNYLRDTATDAASAITANQGAVNAIDQFIGGSSANPMSTIDRWVCYGCMITDFENDTLAYESSKYCTMRITIKPDNCQQYDTIDKMFKDRIESLLPDKVDNALDIVDKIFGNIGL